MTRALALAMITAVVMFATGEQRAISRPNILLVLADDWSYPHASA